MASNLACSRGNALHFEEAASGGAVIHSGKRFKSVVGIGILVGVFLLLQSLIPLRTTVQIGADEGFEMAKATLCLHGYKLYSEVWNDQPPLYTFLVTQVVRLTRSENAPHPGPLPIGWGEGGRRTGKGPAANVGLGKLPSILWPRLVTVAFTGILLTCVFFIVYRVTGLLTGTLTTALLVASPGFLELSSSCMLEIPALAPALAGLSILLVLPRTKWYVAECLAGTLFGIAALTKLVPLYLLPLGLLILWLNRNADVEPSSREDRLKGGTPLTPALSPSDGERVAAGRPRGRWTFYRLSTALGGSGKIRSQSATPFSKTVRDIIVRLLILGTCLVGGFVAVDWLIERGAFIAHFQQSWTSHFGTVQSYEYGSPADHGFEWSILLKNWDITAPALAGIWILTAQVRANGKAILPLAWLCLALVVFTNHKPWWSYYYLHIAIPLCWCAAVGIEAGCGYLLQQWVKLRQPDQRRTKKGRFGRRRVAGGFALGILFAICLLGWASARVYLQIVSIRNSPQVYSALVLKEIARLKPYCKWMYTDQLIYSFHADLPMPPSLAVVPLKRLWAGEMTNERIASELRAFKPEIILLRNDSREQPYQEFLEAEYRMIYQDNQSRLYGQRAMLRQADAARTDELSSPNRM